MAHDPSVNQQCVTPDVNVTFDLTPLTGVQDPSAMPRPTSQDLAGFWDLLQLSIDDVTMKFDQLQQIKNNNWRNLDSPGKKVRGRRATEPGQI